MSKISRFQKLLDTITTPEKAVSLKGKERANYLEALDNVYGDRSKRAKDMGFGDKTYYHGTANADIEKFLPAKINMVVNNGLPGSYFTPNPNSAGKKALAKAFDDKEKAWTNKVRELEKAGVDSNDATKIADTELIGPTSGEAIYPVKIRDDLTEKFTDWGVPSESVKVQNPGVRSVNAAFDPRFKDSDLIMAAKEGTQTVGNILHKLGAPQRKMMNTIAEALGTSGNPEDSEESAVNIVENLANRVGIPEDSTLGAAVKAAGVAGLEVFGDPLNAVPGLGISKKFGKLKKMLGK